MNLSRSSLCHARVKQATFRALHLCQPTTRSRSHLVSMAVNQQQRKQLDQSWQLDPDKPWYHVMPRSGWLNDPNGPIFYQGRYHVFYQHIEGTSQWEWRMSWGHASSSDLTFWRHEPIAIHPTKGGTDASGCWSGTTVLDTDGTPTMIYTGVRRRGGQDVGPLPQAAVDLGLDMIECQMLARCQQDDSQLIKWRKQEQPIIPHPPENIKLTGFRDPYIIQRGDEQKKWKMLLGSGVEGQGGTLLVYEASDLASGWEYKGSFIKGKSRPLGEHDLGAMWECPFFTAVASSSSDNASSTAPHVLQLSEDTLYVMCVSPYPHFLKDRPTNPCLYWLGHVKDEVFQIEESDGPHLLDLGDCLYAPNCFRDAHGRNIMLAWLQELRTGGAFDYAGCISLPRVLSYKDGRLHQQAAPELEALRQEPSWAPGSLDIPANQAVQVKRVRGPSWYGEFTVVRGEAAATGLLLRSWLHKGSPLDPPCAAALLLDWNRSQLEVIFPTALVGAMFDANADMKRIGGPVRLQNVQQVQIKVYVDHSAVEVFISSGEALTTRIYRGDVTSQADPGVYLTSHGGASLVHGVQFFHMGSIWNEESDRPAKNVEPAASQ